MRIVRFWTSLMIVFVQVGDTDGIGTDSVDLFPLDQDVSLSFDHTTARSEKTEILSRPVDTNVIHSEIIDIPRSDVKETSESPETTPLHVTTIPALDDSIQEVLNQSDVISSGAFERDDIRVLPVSSQHGRCIIIEGVGLLPGHLSAIRALMDRPYCKILFHIWRKIDQNSDTWRLVYTSPVFTASNLDRDVVTIQVRNYGFVIQAGDRLGFMDLSLTPCVTYHPLTNPLTYIQTLYHDIHSNDTLPVKGDIRTLLPYQQTMSFNVLADVERYLPNPGSTGTQGGQGGVGYVGEQGPQGQQGPRGTTGQRGIIGIQGITGASGIKGMPGSMGFTGDQGERGFDVFFQGQIGQKGIQGDIGDTGYIGEHGLQGPSGFSGDRGANGELGDPGYQVPGDVGLTGSQGSRGDRGDFGNIGLQGYSGDIGLPGDVGDPNFFVGVRGPPGDPGMSYNPYNFDWCSATSLTCSHACQNTEQGAKCVCQTGYNLTSNGDCREIDECTNKNGLCQHTCENTPGSYYCTCYLGYTLSEDGYRCNDINECTSSICDPEQICVNLEGRHECAGPYTVKGIVGSVSAHQQPDVLLTTNMLLGVTIWLFVITIGLIIDILLLLYISSRHNPKLHRPIQIVREETEPEVNTEIRELTPSYRFSGLPRISNYPRSVAMLDSVPYSQISRFRESRSNSPYQ